MRACSLLFALTLAACPLASQSSRATDWAGDVRLLAREMPRLHPDLFHRLSQSRWDSAVAATEQRIGTLTRTQAIVALMELVALVRDGHSSINPFFNPSVRARYYPVELHRFDDGVFVRSASPAHAALVGARVVRLGRVSIDSAMAAVARVIPHENEWWLRAWGPAWLGLAEVVDGLGLADDAESLPLVIERDGRTERVVLRPAGALQFSDHAGGPTIDRSGWVTMHDQARAPLWLRNPERPYAVEWVPGDRTLYVAYRSVGDAPHGPDNQSFWREVFAMADSLPLARMVIDIRENIGGNSFFNRQVTQGIVARPALNHQGKLFVITGARTFSAAMNLARDLEQWTNATFVGEPTGQARHFFGDHEIVTLPASGLGVAVSTLRWMPYDPRDNRDFLAPAIFAPLTSVAYRAGRDPSMEAILALVTTPPLDQRVEVAVLRGDSAAAAALVRAARDDVANRFRNPEASINALGYRLLNAKRIAPAVTVFRINAATFERSANTWDSLGEALVAAGDRDGGIAAYRRALQLDPGYPSAQQALARLGAKN